MKPQKPPAQPPPVTGVRRLSALAAGRRRPAAKAMTTTQLPLTATTAAASAKPLTVESEPAEPTSRDAIYRRRPSQLVLDVRANDYEAEMFLDPFGRGNAGHATNADTEDTPTTTTTADTAPAAAFTAKLSTTLSRLDIKSITAASVSSGAASNTCNTHTPLSPTLPHARSMRPPQQQHEPDTSKATVPSNRGIDKAVQTDFDCKLWIDSEELTESDREYLKEEYETECKQSVNDIFSDPEMRAMDWFVGMDVPSEYANYRPTAPDADMMQLGERLGTVDDSPFGCNSSDSDCDDDAEPLSLENSIDGGVEVNNGNTADYYMSISPSMLRTRNFRITPPDGALRVPAVRPDFHIMFGSMPTSPPSSDRTAFTVPSETGSDSSLSTHSLLAASSFNLTMTTVKHHDKQLMHHHGGGSLDVVFEQQPQYAQNADRVHRTGAA